MGLIPKPIVRVCDHITQNLNDDLTLDDLSKVSGYSRFHFHRLFSAHVGMGVTAYVQRLRLKRAAHQLAFDKDRKIIDIALDAGFENPSSFTRAFKNAVGQSPSAFRKDPDWNAWHDGSISTITGEAPMEVTIKNFNKTMVAALEHKGPPSRLNHSIHQFIEWRIASGLSPVDARRTFGIAYSDPRTTPPEDFRFDICGEVFGDVPKNAQGVIAKAIPAGPCAIIRHNGSHDGIEDKIWYLYRDWQPGSGRELRDFPVFFQYHNFFPQVAESDLKTDIYLPIL